ncbi:hypothetical protein K6U06_09005 [Acidiferrimicrobium sp. IK]|uniref:sulfocyanin-like copper-binding protein n=1 Tax=Acidiferrimicrobium sp. IK TaxID=2871700 RepID=UPI0021CB0480|nr:sulfocyanin-like copper-binding protein [Acidiferrimicrobium sp. IK]MCU4184498.1 hypothetical protein [Acidiferrimicrobium sp. IK]
MTGLRVNGRHLLAGGALVAALAGVSTVGVAAATGGFTTGTGPAAYVAPGGACNVPQSLPGPVVGVTVTDMGRWMGSGTGMMGGTMRIVLDRSTVPAGKVSLRVVNAGSIVHELVVLPLPAGQQVGERRIASDGKVDEAGSAGEASRSCGAGAGDGIDPGTASWVTLTLPAGTYELVCNLPGHYAAGMYAELTVA